MVRLKSPHTAMYSPKIFDEPRIEILREAICAHPLATLVTLNSAGLEANPIPFVLLTEPAPWGVLCGHVARANPLWQDHPHDADVLAIFHGPENYISPAWYATKAETGKVVPTWNYVSVHAKGKLRVHDDAIWLRTHLKVLTAHNEQAMAHPWSIDDAPRDFIDKMIESIVGIEIDITEFKGKWKVSQNRSPQDQASVVDALRAQRCPAMADLVQSRGSCPH